MRKLLLLAAIATATMAQSSLPETTVIKDPAGHTISTVTTWGATSVFRNAAGELTGSSKIADGKITTYYDPSGVITGTATTTGNVTTMYNAEGAITGTRTREGNVTVIRNAAGEVIGKSERP
jgi:YD repeat-containing protein